MTIRLLALDFGGTKLAAAGVEVSGDDAEVLCRRTAPTPADATASRAVMRELVDDIIAGRAVEAVGVSFGGPVDTSRGLVRASMHVTGWHDHPLAASISKRYGVPCVLLNDANAGAFGEQRWGAGRGLADVLYVTVGTGLGAGLVLGGRLHFGARGLSGELGHLPVSGKGPRCACGRRGCLEAFASGPAIARAARKALRARQDIELTEVGAGLDARGVAELAREGDRTALLVLAEAGRALGRGLTAAALLCDPAAIVLGGSVIKCGEPLLGPARAVLRERAFGEPPPLLTAKFDAEAPLYGAAAAAADLLAAGGSQHREHAAEPFG
jgi:glucokinase